MIYLIFSNIKQKNAVNKFTTQIYLERPYDISGQQYTKLLTRSKTAFRKATEIEGLNDLKL